MLSFRHIPRLVARHPSRDGILSALRAAIAAVDPVRCVETTLRFEKEALLAGPHRFSLPRSGRVCVLGAGKAGRPMAEALLGTLGSTVDCGAVAVPSPGKKDAGSVGPILLCPAAHPVPDQSSVEAARRILEIASYLGEDDLLIVPISGGASSLLTLPADGITLSDLQAVTRMLLVSGADINALNVVRKHLSAIKGGRLAAAAAPARVLSLILSDVVGDPLAVIGSGPTAPDPSTFDDALEILFTANLSDKVPTSVLDRLRRGRKGEIQETPKPGEPMFDRVVNLVVGGNTAAASAAAASLNASGIAAEHVLTPLVGEARTAGARIADGIRRLRGTGTADKPACFVFGGETTVTVQGAGKGGRNQETALATALALEPDDRAWVLTFATDGTDGPTDAAGAAASTRSLADAKRRGLDPLATLNDNDSYHFFHDAGDLLITGPTETNVADLTFVFLR